MWHEARKQEKKIRGMMVDYKRRAERRRDYYERIKQDPAQFLQVHGRPAKIHLDPAVAAAADSPATMMSWQGNPSNVIDRFDVRAHLDIIPDYVSPAEPQKSSGEEYIEDRKTCYERYRTLVQNDFLGVNEDKFLHQIFLEERFGPVLKPAVEEDKKRLADKKAAIGYVYEDSTYDPLPISNPISKTMEDEDEDDEDKDDLSDLDLDITVDVSELTPAQCAEMNEHSLKYGMVDDDFITYLMQDKDEADQLRLAKEIEEEKAMFSGRKSRRERRALREKKLAGRKITSPPSYAARESPTYTPMRHSTSKSRSRSKSPPNAGKIMFITSFGEDGSDVDRANASKGIKDKKASGQKSAKDADKNRRHSKEERSGKSNSSDIVIGPLLPDQYMEEKKSKHKSDSEGHKKSHSSSSSSSHLKNKEKDKHSRKYDDRISSDKKKKRSRYSSSSSSSSRSRSRSKKKSSERDRKHSRSRKSSKSKHCSKSRSRSRSFSRSGKQRANKSRSRSRSRSSRKSNSPQLPPPPVKSYYRHSLSRSSSDISEDSDNQDRRGDSSSESRARNSSLLTPRLQQLMGKSGASTKSKLTPQERLKRKMQLALNRQYKADKKAQIEKNEKQLQERMDRAEELREMAIRLRQRERERRHRLRGYDRGSDSDSSYLRAELEMRDDDDDNLSQHSGKDHKDHSSSSSSSKSSSSSSDECEPVKTSDAKSKSSSLQYSKSPISSSSQRSPVKDAKKVLSSSGHSPTYKKSRASPCHSPNKSPTKNSHPKSRTSSSHDRRDRHDYRRSSSNSPARRSSHASDYRRERRSRSRSAGYSSKSQQHKPLVDY